MTSRLRHLLCLAVAASPQAALAQLTPTSTAPVAVAHVYVQTPWDVNLYNASPTGKLTLALGSPFKAIGLMVGTNGKYFTSNGTNYVHVYAMSSTGAIGKEVSNINIANYSAAECGTTGPTVLDHTGQTLYVQHDNASNRRQLCLLCLPVVQGWQHRSAHIHWDHGRRHRSSLGAPSPLTISGNNYAYGYNLGYETSYVEGFERTASTGFAGAVRTRPPHFS
jgi:hypothetical protein